jgi:plastocyanin
MPTNKNNPTGLNAVIVFEGKKLKAIVPDEIEVVPGQEVEWVVTSEEAAKMEFHPDSPFLWLKQDSEKGRIKGTIQRNAIGVYKYSVSDAAGNDTIDPRIRIKR